jgi:hypothetical protein
MNRKATFAKRQRESDLKDHARAKEARKAARQSAPRATKGPEIAWDQAVSETVDVAEDGTPVDAAGGPSLVPSDDSP